MSDSEKVSITFTETKVVNDHRAGTSAEERFEAGKTYELSPRSADRWVKRGVAHFTTDDDAAKAAGASSDVSLKLQDRDRVDPLATRTAAIGTGTAAEAGGGGGDDGADKTYDTMTKEKLKAAADGHGVVVAGNASKADLIKALERNDTVTAALASGEFETLTVEELKDLSEKESIDLTGKTAKADIVEAVKAHYANPAA